MKTVGFITKKVVIAGIKSVAATAVVGVLVVAVFAGKEGLKQLNIKDLL